MPKLKIADLRELCTSQGYKGADDATSLKSWASDQGWSIKDGEKEVAIKDWEIEDEKPPKVFSLPTKKAAAEDPPDMGEKIEAVVKARLERMGIKEPVSGRPPVIGGEQSTFKTGEQRFYEDRIRAKQAFFSDYQSAMLARHWLLARTHRLVDNGEKAEEHRKAFLELHERVVGKAYSTTSLTAGSALVPDYFMPDLIRNVTEAGTARKLVSPIAMPEATVIVPRRTGGLTMYFPSQNTAVTQSNATYDYVTLAAKSMIGLAQASMQMLADSGLPFMDLTFQEFATAIAQKEDDCFFIGDGTNTYGGMIGYENTANYAATAATAGNTVVGGASASVHTTTQLSTALGTVPPYARANMKITCSWQMVSYIFHRLQQSTPGGLTLQEFKGIGPIYNWLNIPIIPNNSMSTVEDAGSTARGMGFTAGDQIDFLIGDFSKAGLFGTRGGVEMELSRERYFDAYAIGIRAVEQFHHIIHHPGTSSAAGPVVAFYQT